MRLSIAQVISTGGFYGAERVVVELASYLQAEGCDSRLAILDSPGAAKLLEAARAQALPAAIIPCDGPFDRQSIAALRRYLAEHSVQIAHSHGYKSDLWLWLATPRTARKVATAHAWLSVNAKLRFYERLDKLCLRSFARVVSVSPSLLENIRQSGIKTEKSCLIENGLDLPPLSAPSAPAKLRRELGIPADAKLLARVGRLDAIKGNNFLLDALAAIAPRQPAHLLFVGEGEEQAALEKQTRALGLTARVTFAGFRDDVADLLRAADLFVSPSLSEGAPMVLLEAMAARLPVITTEVGAIGAIIRPGANGWLVPPGNAAALARVLEEALNARETGRQCAEQAFQDYAANYSRAAMGRRYWQLYQTILEEA